MGPWSRCRRATGPALGPFSLWSGWSFKPSEQNVWRGEASVGWWKGPVACRRALGPSECWNASATDWGLAGGSESLFFHCEWGACVYETRTASQLGVVVSLNVLFPGLAVCGEVRASGLRAARTTSAVTTGDRLAWTCRATSSFS